MQQNKTAGQAAFESFYPNGTLWDHVDDHVKGLWELSAKAARDWVYVASLGEIAYEKYRSALKDEGVTYFKPWKALTDSKKNVWESIANEVISHNAG